MLTGGGGRGLLLVEQLYQKIEGWLHWHEVVVILMAAHSIALRIAAVVAYWLLPRNHMQDSQSQVDSVDHF